MNKEIFKLLILSILITFNSQLSTLNSYAEEGAGAFLKLGTSARSFSMGGVGVASEFSSDSIYFNPANLSFLNSLSLTSMTNNLGLDRKHHFIGIAQNFGFGGLGLSWLNFNLSEIEIRDETNQMQGFTKDKEDAYFISYAKKINNTGIGFTYKIINHSAYDSSADGSAFDIGLLQKIGDNLTLGIAFQNLSGKVKWDTESKQEDKIYKNTKFGASYKFLDDKTTIVVDFNHSSQSSTSVHFGGEYIVSDILALRAGSNDGKGTFGVGINYSGFSIDYAYVTSDLHNSQRISFRYSPARKEIRKIEKVEAEKPKEEIVEVEKLREEKIVEEKPKEEIVKISEEIKEVKPEEKIEVVERQREVGEISRETKEVKVPEKIEIVEKPKEEIFERPTEEIIVEKPELKPEPPVKKEIKKENIVKVTEGKNEIVINDKIVKLHLPVVIKDGEIFTNIQKKLFTTLGSEYKKYSKDNIYFVEIKNKGKLLTFKISKGKIKIYKDKKLIKLTPNPYILRGRLMIPIKDVYEKLGIAVKFLSQD